VAEEAPPEEAPPEEVAAEVAASAISSATGVPAASVRTATSPTISKVPRLASASSRWANVLAVPARSAAGEAVLRGVEAALRAEAARCVVGWPRVEAVSAAA
jgi:hypothetical protein